MPCELIESHCAIRDMPGAYYAGIMLLAILSLTLCQHNRLRPNCFHKKHPIIESVKQDEDVGFYCCLATSNRN